MAELSSRLGGLAVIMVMRSDNAQRSLHRRNGSEIIDARYMSESAHRPQGQTENRAEVILKLTRSRAFDGPVSGVMYTRGDLILDRKSVV